eukprot:CAMPEP_0168379276 /NCGR_PEP_ID=MMETSP0228-20121227/11761_1 /TAXON_ID=133427 /ORGANISM="Protoceratium reticulatum, Strain CCCM 535 (=CCMP 1889)" /LENGTH=597 /DNA_ID=CAMNT_0008392305 /DNA_START=54 /DNA_END=1847 /DNA_ORIENTATION=+
MAQKAKKTCYYELLGVDRKCEVAEIKASYRKLALRMHPDKAQINGISVEEATQRFQLIQEAYSVLSDAQERAWYDAHREQILRGDDEAGEDPFKTKINLYKYFSAGCFSGFADGAGGFFAVYAGLFEAIDNEEASWEDADEEHVPMPHFGDSLSDWASVSNFYRHWNDFCSRKAFGHADKWNPREAQNRQVRRAMEQENKKARQAAKKDFNSEVRQLVGFVQKRDPRVLAHQKEQMKEKSEKTKRDKEDKAKRKETEALERQQRKDASKRAEQERWAEVQAAKEAQRARGEVLSEDESSEESEAVEYYCEPCHKSFKSEKAFDQHCKSKKHVQIVAKLRRDLEREMEEESREEQASEGEPEGPDLEAGEAEDSTAKGAGGEGREPAGASAGGSPSAESEGEGEDEDEDDFIARLAAVRKPRARSSSGAAAGAGANEQDDAGRDNSGTGAAKANAGAGGEDQEEESSSANEDAKGSPGAADSGGKKAQKRAKQRALLLEKKAERESVQELVNGCKKAQRAAQQGEGEAVDVPAPSGSAPAPSTSAASTSGTLERCGVCGEAFPSRTKLFQHLKVSGHAAPKPAPEAEPGGGKGRRKKR